MRILHLAKRHYTNKDAMAERFGRVYQLPLEWARYGETVRLELLNYRGSDAFAATEDGLDIASTPVRSPRALRGFWGRASSFRPDVVIASGDCFAGLFALRLARRLKARFVFDVYDDYRMFGAYRAFLGWDAYGFLLRHADLVVYASSALAQTHSAAAPTHLAPNGVDPDRFHPAHVETARIRAGLRQEGVRWVGYFGGMDAERGADDLIEAIGLLQANDNSIRLILCGKERSGLRLDHAWIEFHGAVEHSRIPDYINACDVVLLPYRRGPLIDMASSCKIAEYLFCDRPMVVTDTPNFIANFPRQAEELGAAICRAGDPGDLARAIAFQLAEARVASRPEEHSWRAIAQDMLASLQRLA